MKKSSVNAFRPSFRLSLLILTGAIAICGLVGLLKWRAYFRSEAAQQNVKLEPLPTFFARERILIVSPHLDDETLGAGGLIAQARRAGLPVRVVFLSNGDGSGATILAENFSRWRRTSYVEMAQMRQREALRALQQLGVASSEAKFLGFPDGALQKLWQEAWLQPTVSPTTGWKAAPYSNAFTPRAPYCGAQLLSDLTRVVEEFRPTLVLTTHPADTHGDHWSAWAFSNLALQVLAARSNPKNAVQPARILGFLVHHGVWPLPHGAHLQSRLVPPRAQMEQNTRWNEVRLATDNQEAKRRALEEYGSQLIFTPHYLRAFVRINEPFGIVASQRGNSPTVWRDEIGDASGGNGSDLREFSLSKKPDGFTLNLNFADATRSDCIYRIVLHAVEKGRVHHSTLQVLGGRAQLSNGKNVPLRVASRGLEMKFRAQDLSVAALDALLFSVQVVRKRRVVEQSETALWTAQ